MFYGGQIVNFIMMQFLFIPMAASAVLIVKLGGDRFFVWLWLFVCVMCVVVTMTYPAMIDRGKMKSVQLPEGQLRSAFEELATAVDFPHENIFVFNGSMHSRHTNAYFAGILDSKRIVLYDTLLAQKVAGSTIGCSDDEVMAIICHEFGHWKLNHVTYRFLFVQVNLFISLAVFSRLKNYEPMYRALGFYGQRPVLIGLTTVMDFLMAPYNTLMMIFMLCVGREMEYQADNFAKRLGYGLALQKALIKLHKDNLNSPITDRWYYLLNDSHPTLKERLTRLKLD